MALSGNQVTRIGAGGSGLAYLGFVAKAEAVIPFVALPLKSLVIDVDQDLGLTLMPTGNLLSITQSDVIPVAAPPGDKGVVFYIVGGSLTMYVWDTDTNGWIN
jgi:hypothetical protein